MGVQQIVASIVGYQPATKTLRLNDSTAHVIELRLKPRPVQMSTMEVEARDPVEWKKYLEKFRGQFLGTTANAEQCRLINPEVLDFSYDESSDRLIATARAPLEFENRALGYHVECILALFLYSPEAFKYTGLTAFTPLKPADSLEAKRWKDARRDSYAGSKRHFFHAVVQGKARQEGFVVNTLKRGWSENGLARPLGFELDPDKLLESGELPYERRLSIQIPVQVIYARDGLRRVSVFDLNAPVVTVFTNGLTTDPLSMWIFGYWSTQRAADMLPADYEPE